MIAALPRWVDRCETFLVSVRSKPRLIAQVLIGRARKSCGQSMPYADRPRMAIRHCCRNSSGANRSRSSHPRHHSVPIQTRSKPVISKIKADSLRITSENRVPMVIYAAMRPLWPLRSHARPSGIPRTGSANARQACVSLVVLFGNTKVTPRENARKIKFKNSQKNS